MKKRMELLVYIIILETGILISLLGVILLHGMRDPSLRNESAKKNSGKADLILIDTKSGEEIAFPGFPIKEDGNQREQQEVCMKNRKGRILYLGEYNAGRGILTGDLLLTEEELDSFVIVNRQDGSGHALSLYLKEIWTGDYYLSFDINPEEIRGRGFWHFRMMVFYVPI